MNGYEYELLVAEYLRRHGYKKVEVTQASVDYGVDVLATRHGKKYAVQCKYYGHPVGIKAVNEAVGGKAMYGCDIAMVVTNATYTKAARKLAEANDVVLIEGVRHAGRGGVAAFFALYFLAVSALVGILFGYPDGSAAGSGEGIRLFLELMIPCWIYLAVRIVISAVVRYRRRRMELEQEEEMGPGNDWEPADASDMDEFVNQKEE